jgi:hypothetical protein
MWGTRGLWLGQNFEDGTGDQIFLNETVPNFVETYTASTAADYPGGAALN